MGRTFFDLCNEVLNLLTFIPVESFSDLNTPEGRKIKQLMNQVLRDTCGLDSSPLRFRDRAQDIYLQNGVQTYPTVEGFITSIREEENNSLQPLRYCSNWNRLAQNVSGTPNTYWVYENKLYLYPIPSSSCDGKKYTIRYSTDKYATSSTGEDKDVMVLGDDEPIIPEIYRSILVYGVLKDFRGNVGDGQTEFYKRKYNSMCSNLLVDERKSEDNFIGSRIIDKRFSNLDYAIKVFKNPRS